MGVTGGRSVGMTYEILRFAQNDRLPSLFLCHARGKGNPGAPVGASAGGPGVLVSSSGFPLKAARMTG